MPSDLFSLPFEDDRRRPAQPPPERRVLTVTELLRKRGYGGKNDKIARYMQDTFKAHIEARQKLVGAPLQRPGFATCFIHSTHRKDQCSHPSPEKRAQQDL